MDDLYTNRSCKHDFVINGLIRHVEDEMDIFIASAFFTEIDVIKDFAKRNCHIRMVVRLGYPTSPKALEQLLLYQNVEARFYTGHSFHPKLYVFGDKMALVGSANLTQAAIKTNQEVVVGIGSDDPRFEELTNLFANYWSEAHVLTKDAISSYKGIYDQFLKASQAVNEFDDAAKKAFGLSCFSNIDRGKSHKTDKQSIFLDTYRRSYQESVTAFNNIQELYLKAGRKMSEELIPARLEIDSFFSFVRDRYAQNESWKSQPLGWNQLKKTEALELITEWLSIEWEHFDNRIVNINYPLIMRAFSSKESIDKASIEDIIDALCVLHSFHDRLRFYKGGLDTLKAEFIALNDLQNIKTTLKHLLYGSGDIVTRMADCIFSEKYKLNLFGQANVQELIGWVNNESIPVINGRTTKVLRYFGFDVKQL